MREEPQRVRRGRGARMAARAAGPEISPAPPGQTGGAYRPLTDPQIRAIYDAALTLLADLGMGEAPPALIEAATAHGAEMTPLGRLAFPRAMVEEIVERAAKAFVFHGRDPRHDIEIGGERVYFGTGGAAVQTLDLATGRYRPSTLADLHAFTRLIDQLANVSWFTRCCVASDVPDNLDLDINTAYALLRNTSKPVGTSFTLGPHVDPIVDMFDMALGGPGRFADRPFCKAHISPVVSPLRSGEDAVKVTQACIARAVPINCIIAAQSGATAPATLAGFLAQSLAETLAGLALVAVFSWDHAGPHGRGYPVIFSNWPLVIDLRTGAFSGGGGGERRLERRRRAALQLARPALGRRRIDGGRQGGRRADGRREGDVCRDGRARGRQHGL